MLDHRLQYRMVGIERLQIDHAFFLAASRTPGNLRQQLERLFACPEVGSHQPEVGIDHAHQRQIGKVMSLGQNLRTDENVNFLVCRPVDNVRNLLVVGGNVAGKDGSARFGKTVAHFFGDSLHARAARG